MQKPTRVQLWITCPEENGEEHDIEFENSYNFLNIMLIDINCYTCGMFHTIAAIIK